MAALKTVHNKDGVWIGSLDSIVLAIWAGHPNLEHMKIATENHRRLIQEFPGRVFAMSIMPAQTKLAKFDSESRKYVEGVMKELGAQTLGMANVIEGTGLAAATTRTIVAGLALFSGSTAKTFDTVERATQWFEASGKLKVTAAEIAKACTDARSAWRDVFKDE